MNNYPLTTAQMNIHSREILLPGTDVNVLYFVIRIQEKIDVICMQEAVQHFIKGHKAPRTRIRYEDKLPVQYFFDEQDICIETVDYTGWEEEQILQSVRKWGQEPFGYEEQRLWDFKIITFSDKESGLYCKFHHIWCDGWATGLIWTEILSNYCRRKAGQELKEPEYDGLPELIIKQAGYQGSQEETEDIDYFEQTLKEILSEGRRGKAPGHNKADRSRDYQVPEKIQHMLKQFCAIHEVTPYTVFMAALAVYCAGVVDTRTPVLGTARLNREDAKERSVVSQCVLEVPIALQLTENQPFSKLCKSVLKESRAAAVHKRCGMTKIAKRLRKVADFQGEMIPYALSFQREKIHLGDYELPLSVWFGQPASALECILIHVLDLLEDGYRIFYDYRTFYYGQEDILHFHEALLHIMEIGMKENRSVLSLPLTGLREAECLKAPKNEKNVQPIETTLLELFKRQTEERPKQKAVTAKDGSYTYEELDRASDQIAFYLMEQGIQAEEIVGILLQRSRLVPAAMLGIVKAGGAFVLMDQAYPKNRIASIISDGGIRYVLTDGQAGSLLPEECTAVDAKCLPNCTASAKRAEVCPSQLCYVIYTSGSTGEPKGVLIEHRSICHIVNPNHSNVISNSITAGGAALVMGAFSFDISLFELFTSMCNGIPAVIASEEEMKDPRALARLIEEQNICILYGTPSRLLSYCEEPAFRQAAKRLEVIMSAGEAFPAGLYNSLHEIAQKARIYNGYGPTEATIATSFAEVKGEGRITIGTPVAGYKLRCMDQEGRLVPYKETGELYIGGFGLARGYTNAALTEKSFVMLDGERYYCTGDLVVREPDDELIFAGRKDEQVKLRGFRIELEEIESVLSRRPGIKEAAVLVKKSGKAEFLCAFYSGDKEVDELELKSHTAQFLPYYMVPSFFVYFENLPVTRNGKVDRRKLSQYPIVMERTYMKPETTLQKTLAAIVQNVLDLEQVGLDDNFFEIGGDSLSVASYAVEALAQGIEFEYESLYKYPTIRELSKYLECSIQSADAGRDPELADYDYSKIKQLLAGQKPEVYQRASDGVIILTGATGYLGVHILYELLKNTAMKVYCVVRSSRQQTADKRLEGRFFYYFEESLSQYRDNRVRVLEGDITEDGFWDRQEMECPDIVLNCAADVAHYSHNDKMRKLNTDSLLAMIAFCKKYKAELVQISTISIGQFVLGNELKNYVFGEGDLYFGQNLSNAYLRSKFLAERMILEAAAEGSIHAKILRVGNLQARYGDAEFQMNYRSNAFASRLKGYAGLGFVQEELAGRLVDYSPVDYVAKAVCLLASAKTGQTVYHVLNNNEVVYGDFFGAMEECGYGLERCSNEEYHNRLLSALEDKEKKEFLAEIASDLAGNQGERYELEISMASAVQVLSDMGFGWPKIRNQDLMDYISNLDTLGYFLD